MINVELKNQIESEKKERTSNAYNNLVDANTKLMDKINWLKEDIEREIYKIKNNDIFIEEIIQDLETIIKNNKI
jgi:gas vesicle protein